MDAVDCKAVIIELSPHFQWLIIRLIERHFKMLFLGYLAAWWCDI